MLAPSLEAVAMVTPCYLHPLTDNLFIQLIYWLKNEVAPFKAVGMNCIDSREGSRRVRCLGKQSCSQI